MTKNNVWDDENLIKILKEGGVVVMPTDTLYGVVGRAEDEGVVDRIYKIRKRTPTKPCIILISNFEELQKFGIALTEIQKNEIEKYKEPTSFVLDCIDDRFSYLHRGTNTLAIRVPSQRGLQNLLKETGPLVAPSANVEGLPPAKNIQEARGYFGDLVDLYTDGGELEGKASKIIKLEKDASAIVLRE